MLIHRDLDSSSRSLWLIQVDKWYYFKNGSRKFFFSKLISPNWLWPKNTFLSFGHSDQDPSSMGSIIRAFDLETQMFIARQISWHIYGARCLHPIEINGYLQASVEKNQWSICYVYEKWMFLVFFMKKEFLHLHPVLLPLQVCCNWSGLGYII